MKFALPLLSAALLATVAACQSTHETSGPPRNYSDTNQFQNNENREQNTMAPPSSPARPGVEHGDAYKEQMLDRYDINEDR